MIANKNIMYLIVSEKFTNWALKNGCAAAISFGEEFFLSPTQLPKPSALLRKKIRKATREQISAFEYLVSDPQLEAELQEMVTESLKVRQGPQTFIAKTNLFQTRLGRRFFYVKKNNKLLAVAWINQLNEKKDWVLSQFVLASSTPVGTSEFLINFILETLAQEQCSYLSFGAVPAQTLSSIYGLNKFSSFLIKAVFRTARKIFHLDGKRIFWEKFQPQKQRVYLVFGHKKIKIRDLIALAKTSNMQL